MSINYYSSLKDYFNANSSEQVGDYIQTLGFETEGDGGSAVYQITSNQCEERTELYINAGHFYNGRQELTIISENGAVNVEQFGAKGNVDITGMNESDLLVLAENNRAAIANAVKTCHTVDFSPAKYIISNSIVIDAAACLRGHNATLVLHTNSNNTSLIDITNVPAVGYSTVELSEFNFCGKFSSTVTTTPSEQIKAITVSNSSNIILNKIHFNTFDIVAKCNGNAEANSPTYKCDNIRFEDCTAENVNNGLMMYSVTDLKVRNFRIDVTESDWVLDGVGIMLSDNCYGANIEDLSVLNAKFAPVVCRYGVWDSDATHGIFFKNLLVDGTRGSAVTVTEHNIPIRFANAMVTDVAVGMTMTNAENVTMVNSSVLINNDVTNPTKKRVFIFNGLSRAKFTKTQFEFPADFQDYSSTTAIAVQGEGETAAKPASEIAFVDCTLQKTDMPGVPNVDRAVGFGKIGYSGTADNQIIETFDACEFRSYQSEYILYNDANEIVGYAFPIEIHTRHSTNSKIIFKNSRFVNDSACTLPYFFTSTENSLGNLVVYNCFFENYTYSKEEDGVPVYHLFASAINNDVIVTGSFGFDIFAKCNMRSSTPMRNTGTVINETKAYE